MKKISFLLCITCILCYLSTFCKPLFGQTKNVSGASRQVELNEVWRVADKDKNYDFYLKSPQKIITATDESLIIFDSQRILRFSSSGKFLGCLFKRGSGPGEYNSMIDIKFSGKRMYAFTFQPYKVLEADMEGTYIKEYRLDSNVRIQKIVAMEKNKFYFFRGIPKSIRNLKSGPFERQMELVWSLLKGGSESAGYERTEQVFPEKWYVIKHRGMRVGVLEPINHVFDGNDKLFLSNTREYLIKIVSLSEKKVVGTIKRKYKSVPYKLEEPEEDKEFSKIAPEYFCDIQDIFLNKEQLWVLTSTRDERKGWLVDIFNLNGRFLESVFLDIPGKTTIYKINADPIAIHDSTFISIEETEQGDKELAKYKIRETG
jgi:hypothetical protein